MRFVAHFLWGHQDSLCAGVLQTVRVLASPSRHVVVECRGARFTTQSLCDTHSKSLCVRLTHGFLYASRVESSTCSCSMCTSFKKQEARTEPLANEPVPCYYTQRARSTGRRVQEAGYHPPCQCAVRSGARRIRYISNLTLYCPLCGYRDHNSDVYILSYTARGIARPRLLYVRLIAAPRPHTTGPPLPLLQHSAADTALLCDPLALWIEAATPASP